MGAGETQEIEYKPPPLFVSLKPAIIKFNFPGYNQMRKTQMYIGHIVELAFLLEHSLLSDHSFSQDSNIIIKIEPDSNEPLMELKDYSFRY